MQAFVKLFSRGKLEGTDSGRRTVSAEPTFRVSIYLFVMLTAIRV